MTFIFTTATAADKFKREAKTLRKSTGTSLAVALDTIAKQHGYEHWKHVTSCQEQTASLKALPHALTDLLDQASERKSASVESLEAFAHGFAFAMDVKDAQELALTPEYAACDDGWYLAARDLWKSLIYSRDDETGTTLFEMLSPTDLVDTALDDLQNYRFFRYVGIAKPVSLEQAYKKITGLSFFPPTHVWLNGRFIDISEIPEIRVDGQVMHSTQKGITVLSSGN